MTAAARAGLRWARGFVIVVPYDASVLEAARAWRREHGTSDRDVRLFAFAATIEIERRRSAER